MTSDQPSRTSQPSRNDPCPCGSGKKYKRCHGLEAAPKTEAPAAWPPPAGQSRTSLAASPPGSPDDSAQLAQAAKLMNRLPKAQLQRMQAMMQKAMAGKDVSREARELEASLPPGFLETMKQLQPDTAAAEPQGPRANETPHPEPSLSESEARRLVEEAAAEGRISAEEAAEVLSVSGQAGAPFWKRWLGTGRKP